LGMLFTSQVVWKAATASKSQALISARAESDERRSCLQGMLAPAAAKALEQAAPEDAAGVHLSCRATQNGSACEGAMERQGSCPVKGSSPTNSMASGSMSARSARPHMSMSIKGERLSQQTCTSTI
jgi:hypothetical protein